MVAHYPWVDGDPVATAATICSCTAAVDLQSSGAQAAVAAASRSPGAQRLRELAQEKRERRAAVAAAAAQAASCQLRIEQEHTGAPAQLASGFLVRLPCGPCLVTAAHALGGPSPVQSESAPRTRAKCIAGIAAGRGLSPKDGRAVSSAVHFQGDPARFWRHDPVLDVIVVAVRASSARRTRRLREVSLPIEQLASTASLCSTASGAPVQLTHRQGTTVAIVRPAGSAGATAAASLQTRSGCPLLIDYNAPLIAGTSGAAVYDTRWRLVGVHVRGDEVEARGRGVSIDAVRELIECAGNDIAPLSTRVRLVTTHRMAKAAAVHAPNRPGHNRCRDHKNSSNSKSENNSESESQSESQTESVPAQTDAAETSAAVAAAAWEVAAEHTSESEDEAEAEAEAEVEGADEVPSSSSSSSSSACCCNTVVAETLPLSRMKKLEEDCTDSAAAAAAAAVAVAVRPPRPHHCSSGAPRALGDHHRFYDHSTSHHTDTDDVGGSRQRRQRRATAASGASGASGAGSDRGAAAAAAAAHQYASTSTGRRGYDHGHGHQISAQAILLRDEARARARAVRSEQAVY